MLYFVFSMWREILKFMLIVKIGLLVAAAGGIPLHVAAQRIKPVYTMTSLQKELSAFRRLPLYAKLAQIRENPDEQHLVLELLDGLQDHCDDVRRLCDLYVDNSQWMRERGVLSEVENEGDRLIRDLARQIKDLDKEDGEDAGDAD